MGIGCQNFYHVREPPKLIKCKQNSVGWWVKTQKRGGGVFISKISPFLPPLEKLFPVMFSVFWFELKKVVFVAKFIISN